jgi:hypothetical protein
VLADTGIALLDLTELSLTGMIIWCLGLLINVLDTDVCGVADFDAAALLAEKTSVEMGVGEGVSE